MDYRLISAQAFMSVDDWRPGYHLTPSSMLDSIGASWPAVASLGGQFLEGWRFSDKKESDWYLKHVELRDPATRDPITQEYTPLTVTMAEREMAEQIRGAIEGELYYRMRHVEAMEIAVSEAIMRAPAISGFASCVQPGDIIIRRKGAIRAALVSNYHRRHPVDANIAIVRGLPLPQAIWLTYCLNQPFYQEFYSEPGSITNVTRVGLKKLKAMPLAPRPHEFDSVAATYWQCYEQLVAAEDKLQLLREEVRAWVRDQVPQEFIQGQNRGWRAEFFDAMDVENVLTYAATDQHRFQRELVQKYKCVPLDTLAEINPKGQKPKYTAQQVVKISDINGQLEIDTDTDTEKASSWRFHNVPLRDMSVLVSTFVQDPRVGVYSRLSNSGVHASEQLAVLNFHRSAGAYALLLESELVQQQLSRLASGMLQRFVHPELFNQLVLPTIDEDRASIWHERFKDIQIQKHDARSKVAALLERMYSMFRKIHPEITTSGLKEGEQING